jgi:hypothetical protein
MAAFAGVIGAALGAAVIIIGAIGLRALWRRFFGRDLGVRGSTLLVIGTIFALALAIIWVDQAFR